ncbi:MAG: apolipoprotein N-acyltransferase [Trueperaceae bacterium]|nr:apolipoprotein N-acyltransferase [Trueperaceae bacterium]
MIIRLLLAAAAGIVLSTSLPPSPAWFAVAALAVVFALVAGSPGPRAAFWVAFAAAVAFFALHVLWLPASFSDLLGPVFWVLFPFLLAALGAIWGATVAAARWVGRGGAPTLFVLATFWVLMTWLRGLGFLGFPWGTLGYAWLDTPVAQWADLVGVHGLSLFTTWAAALLAAPFVRRSPATDRGAGSDASRTAPPRSNASMFGPPLALVLVLLAWWGGDLRAGGIEADLPAAERSALLVQGDVDPFGRAAGADRDLDVHVELTESAVGQDPPDLVIWPEGAVLGYPLEGFRGEPARRAIQEAAPQSAFVVGGRARTEGGSTNAVFAIRGGALSDRYDKHVLVPFGERWPLLEVAAPLYRAIFGLFGLPLLENTVPGPGPRPLETGAGRVAAYVCYESVFPRIPRGMVQGGAEVLINITNDAWFSRGNGARQHFDMGRLRAIETRRWLLRAGNDGITAAVDPLGRTVEALPRGERGTLRVSYARLDGVTPYVRHGHLTPWLLLGLGVATSAFAAVRRR